MTLLTGITLAGGLLVAPAEASGGAVVELKNAATGMCLAIGRGEARKGKTAIQWPCIHSPAQRWLMTSEGHLVNVATGMCLAIGGGQERRARPPSSGRATAGGRSAGSRSGCGADPGTSRNPSCRGTS
ncbi:RICIN domain-containing protein [Nonomuraea recticatena]|uniref:RICIN domain-containing protein n=1 Tax=Nonomuraea recticatena TaxID=46178 RepID=UPI0036074410